MLTPAVSLRGERPNREQAEENHQDDRGAVAVVRVPSLALLGKGTKRRFSDANGTVERSPYRPPPKSKTASCSALLRRRGRSVSDAEAMFAAGGLPPQGPVRGRQLQALMVGSVATREWVVPGVMSMGSLSILTEPILSRPDPIRLMTDRLRCRSMIGACG